MAAPSLLMLTVRLGQEEGPGAAPPPLSAAAATEAAKEHRQQHRGRGPSLSASASSSSARSRRVLGMDEPTAVAAALVATSAFLYSVESVNVKLLGKDVGFWTISVWRGVVGLVCCVGSYLAGRRREGTHWAGRPELRQFLALRGAMGAAAVISSFAALTNMDLADATCLMSTAPLWTAAMAVGMQKSECGGGGFFSFLFVAGLVFMVVGQLWWW